MIITLNLGPRIRKVLYAGLAMFLVLTAGHYLWFNNNAEPTAGEQKRLVPIYYVQTEDPQVAISFDATWGADNTETILDILDENEIKTTFFLCGHWVEDYPNLVKEIYDRGHEIGNHTATHPHLNSLTETEIKAELQQIEDMVTEAGANITKLFRPPFGEYNNTVIETAGNMGYKSIQWSIDSLDWQELGADAILNRVTSQLHPGAIVLFHNAGVNTPEALPEIISYIQGEGYKIVPVSQLIYQDNYTIDSNTGAQIYNPPPEPEDQ